MGALGLFFALACAMRVARGRQVSPALMSHVPPAPPELVRAGHLAHPVWMCYSVGGLLNAIGFHVLR